MKLKEDALPIMLHIVSKYDKMDYIQRIMKGSSRRGYLWI